MLTYRGVTAGYRRGLRRRFALEQLSVELRAGEITALVGPNGAGKTTFLRLGCGQLRPWSGRVVRPDTRIAFVPDQVDVPKSQTLARFLRYGAFLAGFAWERAEAAVVAAARDVRLLEHLQDTLGSFSRGMSRRATLAFVLLERPRALLLDEPWAGLDTVSRRLLRQVLRAEADRGTLVVASSHDLDQVERIADRVLVLERGRLSADLDAAPGSGALEAQVTGSPS